MHIDVFRGDGFSLTSLTASINSIPFIPTRIRDLGWFREEGVATTSIEIEMQNDVLFLVPSKPRGAPGTPVTRGKPNLRQFKMLHLPQTAAIQADEVQNLRAFGSETEMQTAQNLMKSRMALARQANDLTIEYQRIGAVKGVTYDADGTTVLWNWYTEFGVTQQVLSFALTTSTTEISAKILTLQNMIEDQLGGISYTQIRVLCSPEFFSALITVPSMKAAYANSQANAFLRTDNRKGFEFGDIIFEQYRGSVGSNRFIAAGDAYAVPEGVPGMFVTNYAPANYMETVGTIGLPYYARTEMADFNKGVMAEIQSNPISYNTRPGAVVRLTMT